MIHLLIGNGRGKTTAAVGLALRKLNNKEKVLLVSFLKNGQSGESVWLRNNSDIKHLYQKDFDKFVKDISEHELKYTKNCQKGLLIDVVRQKNNYSTIILDELTDTIDLGLIALEEALEAIKEISEVAELIITGHNGYDQLIEMADYYTEFVSHKHPFDKGIKAKKGVEF